MRRRAVVGTSSFPTGKEAHMLRSVALWLLGIPIPIIILLWLFLD